MIKKYLWIAVLIFGFISCEEAPNDYSPEANAFLDAINGKEYNGAGAYKDIAWFEAHGVVISEHKNDNTPTVPLFFQPNETTGTSVTRAIYRQRISAGVQGDYVGIEIENSGDTLKRTLPNSTPDVDWNTAPVFATKK